MNMLVIIFLFVFCISNVYCQNGVEVCLNLTPSPVLEKYVDELPEMPIISLANIPFITIGAYKITQKLHRDLPPTTLYAFGTTESTAVYPGPTLIAQQGVNVTVRWENHIPDVEHMLPVDRSLAWANPRQGYVPITVHNHGQETEGWADGHPQSWFTVTGEHGPTYITQEYVYPNDQRPGLLFYHDHTLGINRLNVAAGLVGAYVIESLTLEPQWIPRIYRILIVQDKSFYEDGSVKYPTVGINPSVHPQWCPDYDGDTVIVNGKIWPYIEVKPTIYRFRLVNAANSRLFLFTFDQQGLSFIKTGTDGTFLHIPVKQSQLRLGVAERADFLVDFSGCTYGQRIQLLNVAPTPYPVGPPANQSVMLFRIVREGDRSAPVCIPAYTTPEELSSMNPVQIIYRTTGEDLSTVDWSGIYQRPLRQLVIFEDGGLVKLTQSDFLRFDDPVTEIIKLYSAEVWVWISLDQFNSHSMHLHLVNFVVFEQQPFDLDRYVNGSCSFVHRFPDPRSCYTDVPRAADADQVGLKDTAVVLPLHVTRFYVVFRPNLHPTYRIDPTKPPGYLHHCHLLEHEDNEMMRPLQFTHAYTLYSNASFPPTDVYSLE